MLLINKITGRLARDGQFFIEAICGCILCAQKNLSFKMRHQEFEPPGELCNTIKCFWYNSRDFGTQDTDFEVVPDGYAEIIFHFGGGCSIVDEERALQPLPSPFIVGLLNRPAVFLYKGRLEIIAVRCFPWTVFDLLCLQAAKDRVLLFDHPVARLQPTLAELVEAGNITHAVDLLKQYFLDVRPYNTADNTLFKAGDAMRDANGSLPVSQVAAAAHATVRTLERKFKRSSGYSVKDVSGLIRFEQVRNQLWRDPNTNLAGLAADLGYTDQAHLSREFKRYSGTTPGAFARKSKKKL